MKHHSDEPMKQSAKPKDTNQLPKWDSHLNMHQMVKNRKKLNTPNSDESIQAYAETCRAKFYRKCSETKAVHSKRIMSKTGSKGQPIYTKPYSSDSYSDIQNVQRAIGDRMNSKQSGDYTSVTGSNGFLSPNSISIDGVPANSTSNTTTHQYDTKISVGLQTTNTLERMPIIQLKNPIEEPKVIKSDARSTVRVNKLTINKQLQVRPEALAYIIMFKEGKDKNGDLKRSKGQQRDNQLYVNSNKDIAIGSSANSDDSSELNALNANDKQSGVKEKTTQFEGQTSSNSSSVGSFENLTLQECLQARRPDFYANAEQRRKCLNNLHNLRQQRNEQRKKLLALNICTNAKTLNRHMKRLLPPPPLGK